MFNMKKFFTFLFGFVSCFAVLFAAVKTEMRMRVLKGGELFWQTAVEKVLSIDFQEEEDNTSIVQSMNVSLRSEDEKWQSRVDAFDSLCFQRDTLKYDVVKDGALIAATFNVTDKKKICFSQGNLQFNAVEGTHVTADGSAAGTWRFAENQYDYVGSANDSISETYHGWIDLFAWGTSGWNSGAKEYQPWATSDTHSDYNVGGEEKTSLTDSYANADWGVFNAISNGGNQPTMWNTLTADEWSYLLSHYKWTMGMVGEDSVLCFMLLPDDFQTPANINMSVLSDLNDDWDEADYSSNVYTDVEFAKLEREGVVALPCSGRRMVKKSGSGNVGNYWSSTSSEGGKACKISFSYTSFTPQTVAYKDYGYAVRLVKHLNYEVRFLDYDGSVLLDSVYNAGDLPVAPSVSREDGKYRYYFKGWDKEITEAKEDIVYTALYDSTLIVRENGLLKRATVRVSDGRYVYFSQGNLQYNAKSKTWRLADNQYDIVGMDNKEISEKYDGWIDLFGFGTSGWNSNFTSYQPWATEISSDSYQNNSLKYDYINSDWAFYNDIVTTGVGANSCRTLTGDEWKYIIENDRWTMGEIGDNGVLCFMIFPEDYVAIDTIPVYFPEDKSIENDVVSLQENSFENNVYSEAQFGKLEELGVVALPCGGHRYGETISNVNVLGMYWSTTSTGDASYNFKFSSSSVGVETRPAFHGFSVRPVQDLSVIVKFVNYDGTVIYDFPVEYGKMPIEPATPTRNDSDEYQYTFKGWDKEVSKAICDVIYTAVYDSTLIDKADGLR